MSLFGFGNGFVSGTIRQFIFLHPNVFKCQAQPQRLDMVIKPSGAGSACGMRSAFKILFYMKINNF